MIISKIKKQILLSKQYWKLICWFANWISRISQSTEEKEKERELERRRKKHTHIVLRWHKTDFGYSHAWLAQLVFFIDRCTCYQHYLYFHDNINKIILFIIMSLVMGKLEKKATKTKQFFCVVLRIITHFIDVYHQYWEACGRFCVWFLICVLTCNSETL